MAYHPDLLPKEARRDPFQQLMTLQAGDLSHDNRIHVSRRRAQSKRFEG